MSRVVKTNESELVRVAAQHSVHPTGGSRRVFKRFSWLEAGSVKMALPRLAHQRVTQAVSPKRFLFEWVSSKTSRL